MSSYPPFRVDVPPPPKPHVVPLTVGFDQHGFYAALEAHLQAAASAFTKKHAKDYIG